MKSLLLPVTIVMASAAASYAGVFALEVRTTSTKPTELPPTWPASANRLHISGYGDASDTIAPLGTTVWMVADTLGNGIPAALFDTGAGSTVPSNQILGPDDVIIKADLTDGQAPGNFAGRYFSGAILMDDEANDRGLPVVPRNSQFFFLVWSVQTATDAAAGMLGVDSGTQAPKPFPSNLQDVRGDGTMSFGFFNMGTASFPALGNGGVGVYENLFADHMTVVPEPAAYAAAGAGALLGFAFLRRKTARRA